MRVLAGRAAAYVAAACIAATPCNPAAFATELVAPAPDSEAQAILRKAFVSQRAGLLGTAETGFSSALQEWERSGQPADEVAALYKQRGIVRQEQGKLLEALVDLSKSLDLAMAPGSKPDPAEIQRTFVLRARVNEQLQRWRAAESDLSAAITRLDDMDAIEATNPYLYAERSTARSRLGQFADAADDALQAEADYKAIGDKVRRLLATAESAIALYGAGDVEEAVSKIRFEFANKGMPATNNPDDIPLLQELSRRDAELHLAYAGHLYSEGKVKEAATQWESGCIRIEAYVRDGEARQKEESALLAEEQRLAESSATSETLRASTVKDNLMNSNFVARLNGLDPQSPYVNQRPQRSYFWYKVGEGEIERRDAGNPLAEIDASLSCAKFRSEDWLIDNRADWPPNLRKRVVEYAEAVPQGPIVMPPKGSPPSRGEVVF